MTTINSTAPITCTFPDQSTVILERIVELSPTHAHIIYLDEGLVQELWVPHDFVSSNVNK